MNIRVHKNPLLLDNQKSTVYSAKNGSNEKRTPNDFIVFRSPRVEIFIERFDVHKLAIMENILVPKVFG